MGQNLHLTKAQKISVSQAVLPGFALVLDVRSPAEWAVGHIPGSVNLPLLDDQERHLIGILYKNEGPAAAIDQGYRYFEPKEQTLANQLLSLPKDRPLVIACARGGMRSQVMTGFAERIGCAALQLEGGYKAYRGFCLQLFETHNFKNLVVLHGSTGVGKTLVIKGLNNAIDLEGYAGHRGSMFGGVGLEEKSQKNFEGLLVQRLLEVDWSRPVFIEGESRKVGRVSLPPKLFEAMCASWQILLTAPLKIRVERTRFEYIDRQPQCVPQIRELVARLYQDLGHQRTAELLAWFDEGQYDSCFGAILTEYYDKKYDHTLNRMTFEAQMDTSDLLAVVALLEGWA